MCLHKWLMPAVRSDTDPSSSRGKAAPFSPSTSCLAGRRRGVSLSPTTSVLALMMWRIALAVALLAAWQLLSGTVIEVNEALRDDPSLANSDPLDAGWFFKVKLDKPEELDGLMNRTAYEGLLQTL